MESHSGLLRVRHLLEVGVAIAGVLVPVLQMRPDEPSNILSLSAVEANHAPQSVCSKDDAPENTSTMWVTLETSHFERSPLNDVACENMKYISVTLDTSQLEMSPLKEDADVNMERMLVTLDTSHLEMSQLNDDAYVNM